MSGTHRTAEPRSLALHSIAVQRVRDDAAVVVRARERAETWLADGGPVDQRWARRWDELLHRPREEFLAALVADTEEMRDLRQCSPFAGVVTPAERWRIVREVHEDGNASAAA